MQLHFRNRMFDYDKILKILAIGIFYHVVSILLYICGYQVQYAQRVDIEQLIYSFQDMMFFIILFSIGVIISDSKILARFLIAINYSKLSNNFSLIVFVNCEQLIYTKKLDESNPFLYSNKTKSLRE